MRSPEEKCICLSGAALLEFMQAVLLMGDSFRFSARGQSMTPFVRDGDIITIAPLAGQSPRVGDVVAFVCSSAHPSGPIVHRIVDRRGACYVIQGDGYGAARQTVLPENIVGRLVKVERDGRCVRLGLGPERWLIAWLSRTRLFFTLVWPLWKLIKNAFVRQRPVRQ